MKDVLTKDLWFSKELNDEKTLQNIFYTISANKNKYEFTYATEWNIYSFLSLVYAEDKVVLNYYWDEVWFLLNSDDTLYYPSVWNSVDIETLDNSLNIYKIKFSNDNETTKLEEIKYNTSCKRLYDYKWLQKSWDYTLDIWWTDYTVYCPMEFFKDWSLQTYYDFNDNIKDYSWNWNDLIENNIIQMYEDTTIKTWRAVYQERSSTDSPWSSYISTLKEKSISKITLCQLVNFSQADISSWAELHWFNIYFSYDDWDQFRFAVRWWNNHISDFYAIYYSDNYNSPSVSTPLNSWNQLCQTYNWKEVKIYINWELNNTHPLDSSKIWKTIKYLWYGLLSSFIWYTTEKWSIDEVMIFNRDLSSKEIKSIYDWQRN